MFNANAATYYTMEQVRWLFYPGSDPLKGMANMAQCPGCGARLRDERGNCAYCGSGVMPTTRELAWNPELAANRI